MRSLTAEEIAWIAEGAAALGAGGGGNPYVPALALRRLVRGGHTVRVLDPSELPARSAGVVLCGMGAPTVGLERLPTAGRYGDLVRSVATLCGVQLSFIVISEIGGGNAIVPLIAAAESGLPVVDADANGRAFPELQMNTFMIAGLRPEPLVLDDGKHVRVVLTGLPDATTAERYARALTWAMGGSAGTVHSIRTAEDVRAHAIPGMLGVAESIGRAMQRARSLKMPVAAGLRTAVPGATPLFEGKIVDIERRTAAGFARGTLQLEGLGEHQDADMTIDFQNEFLVAWIQRGSERTVALAVPDLLVLFEAESGIALSSESVRYGLRVCVIGIPAPAALKTARALQVTGPRAFGYDLVFVPLPGAMTGDVPA